ncbi:hypothetical protein [Brevundimonas naejangsanensis]|uniref:hypothetical protein n=1 Tax=Brevundimonas naejangsanensis TaxID=588932 RepID=UPI0034D460AE
MVGSPWLSYLAWPSTSRRIAQHALPSLATLSQLESAGYWVFMRLTASGSGDVISVNRNGFTSDAAWDLSSRYRVDEFIYWDGAKAQRMQPFLGLGPEPYDW